MNTENKICKVIKEKFEYLYYYLFEDYMELSEETKRSIGNSLKEIEEGKVITFEELKKELMN